MLEILIDVSCSLPVDLFVWGYEEDKPETKRRGGLFVAGCLLGGFSAAWLPQSFLHHGWSRMINIIASPLLAGWVAVLIARWMQRRDKEVSPKFQFWRAFWFTLGFTLVRFAYRQHGIT